MKRAPRYSVPLSLAAILAGLCLLPVFAQQVRTTTPAVPLPETTYERFAPLASAGDPEAQQILGFMHFYGEGAKLDYNQSHYWFHEAAEEGNLKAIHNLGMFHSDAVGQIPATFYDPRESNLWFSLAAVYSEDPRLASLASKFSDAILATDKAELLENASADKVGKMVYVGHCAGCHGFDGIPQYPNAPAFAAGERLNKQDYLLIGSILRGGRDSPHWHNDLSEDRLDAALSYIRESIDGNELGIRRYAELQSARERHLARIDEEVRTGEKFYRQFCGGCHGFNGIAWYVNSPSFALGERLHKDDAELARSIRNGIGLMPSWEYMLKPGQIDALVRYVRTFSMDYEQGIKDTINEVPHDYFRFVPRGEPGFKRIGKNPTGS